MKVIDCTITGLKIIEPTVFYDQRGYFYESYSKKNFDQKVAEVNFVQDNQSKSVEGVARGLHFQAPPFAQAKLVRCVIGEVLDIALDIRQGSPTYGKFQTVILSAEKHNQFFVPKGFAHGFMVLSREALFQYKCDDYYAPETYGGINIMDPEIGLNLDAFGKELILSPRDMSHPNFKDFVSPFVMGVNC